MTAPSSASIGSPAVAAAALYPLVHSVHAVLILDNDGRKLFGKYHHVSDSTRDAHRVNEEKLWATLRRRPLGEVALVDNRVVVYRHNLDVTVYVVSPALGSASLSGDVNELVLASVLDGLFESMEALLKYRSLSLSF